MLRSLSAQLILAFAFIVVLALAISGAGTLWLLRDQEREAAEERVGRLAEPVTLALALLGDAGIDQAEKNKAVAEYADSFDVRILLVDEFGRVVADTESKLVGTTIDAVADDELQLTSRGSASFRMTGYSTDEEDLFLFAAPDDSVAVSDRLALVQLFIYQLPPSLSRAQLQAQVDTLITSPDAIRFLPKPELRPLVAVPEQEITSAWRDVIPQLVIAGAAALLASVAAALLVSRSISRPLARMTRAAQEMARGNYDQKLDLRREDEVGRLSQAFDVMAGEVSHSHQMMRDFLANVSHELKTPLTSIQGFSQAMEDGAISSEEEYRDAAHIINEESQRMRGLVDDLIDLSRLESGQAVIERAAVDPGEVLRSSARRFQRQAKEKGVDLGVDLADLPRIEGDGRRLEQVFSNLIDNAIRHTPEGGAVSVRAEAPDGVVRVTVHNSGSYIPPEDTQRVFERFFQLDRNRSSGNGGSGLGLAIARELVQAHRGSIVAHSDREAGTEFIVALPVTPQRRNGGTQREPA
ncbi:MAG: ATP-binding protein [Dehalococcoidia bacterium]